jgi:hypothetical protein
MAATAAAIMRARQIRRWGRKTLDAMWLLRLKSVG